MLAEVSDFILTSAFTLIASIGCVMMLARLLVYVYMAYACTTVTVRAFNYARASRRTADQSDICASQDCVSTLRCRDKKLARAIALDNRKMCI